MIYDDPFRGGTLMLGDFQFVWWGWRWALKWPPIFNLSRIPADNPMAIVWRWQFFLGPLEIRRWVPRPSPQTTERP